MTRLLLIDTCGEGGGVGVSNGDVLLVHRPLPGRETQERLMAALSEVLSEAAVAWTDLAAVAVVVGPGSFTGVRIGLAAAKGLTEATGLPLIALSRLEILEAQGMGPDVQAWIDAGRTDVYVRHRGQDVMLPAAAAVAGAEKSEVIVMEDRLVDLLPAVHRVPPVGVAEALPLAMKRLAARQFDDAALLQPNYLRVPDAELALRARLSAQ